jgi:hypothetical protein
VRRLGKQSNSKRCWNAKGAFVEQQPQNTGNGMRISARVLEDVCKRMIEVILFCLPDATKGTIYSVGPMPDLRVIRITSGRKEGPSEELIWGAPIPSDYDPPGKVWDLYRDRPGALLEAMAWCVKKQKSWTSDDPKNNIRSVRKQLEGKAGEDYHHMEPVLVKKADLWDIMPPTNAFQKDISGKPLWIDSQFATVAVIKIHFQPGSIKQGDRSTRIIKELSHSLGTQILSLHAREVALEKETRLIEERRETCDVLAHEFRNLVPRMWFAYRAINNEISYLREMWENLIHEHCPEQSNKRAILQQLGGILRDLEAEYSDLIVANDIARLSRYQQQLMDSCFLPQQNENWLRQKIGPLWESILSKTDLRSEKNQIEELLEDLGNSFHAGLDKRLRDKVEGVPAELKEKWVDLAYRELNGRNNGMLKQYIEFLDNIDLDLPRKRHCVKNLVYLKSLVELIPEVEKKLNHQLGQLKNSK